jgi:putative hydrolase of the HAD superfamily
MTELEFDPRKIRWIALDAVGTVIHPQPSAGVAYHRVGLRHGSRLAAADVSARFGRVFAQVLEADNLDCGCAESGDRLHTCETRERIRWQRIVRGVLDDVATPDECFAELFAHFGQPTAWACFPEVGAALQRLRQAGYHLAVCSNFDARLNAVMAGLPELAPIELRIISSEVGCRKPSPRFFEALVRAAGCSPSEILFIGDDPTSDVAAARNSGLAALQIDHADASLQNRALRSLDDLVARLL